MSDRKRMVKVRKKRIGSIDKQILLRENKIKNESPSKGTTKEYWITEIEKKFKKIKEEDEKYLKENKDK
ncbi:MAG TPA: hypothetical protein VJH92_06265 [Candidatus Nanoarchaeia archaeon]|nr:hypothetical protein [Candidatus Nanoarchaeia archaeon]